jgi:hypothetical protein
MSLIRLRGGEEGGAAVKNSRLFGMICEHGSKDIYIIYVQSFTFIPCLIKN